MKSELNFKSLVLITNQLPFVHFMSSFVIYCENLTLQASQKWNILCKRKLKMDTTVETLDLK